MRAKAGASGASPGRSWLRALGLSAALATAAIAAGPKSGGYLTRQQAEGRELFEKVWEPGEPSRHGGDGLGPLYNERSCVGCHNQGGNGGGGPNSNNVRLLTAFAGPPQAERGPCVFIGELEELHPAFRRRTSVVLHRHAIDPDDGERLDQIRRFVTVQTQDELVALRESGRNTPALFGSGLIDQVPDAVLTAAQGRRFDAFPEIKGRVSRLKDGRIGRFGWKGQTATLREFVLGACSNELGLEVPGHHQAGLAAKDDPARRKLDLDEQECRTMTEFVRHLPAPRARPLIERTAMGRRIFEAIGCATCHAPSLGPVREVYSDLLLHDLGDRISDSGGGYGGGRTTPRIVEIASGATPPPAAGEVAPTEWRTPPLWGVADSAPYLHDGRAATLDEAVRLHGGEAAETTKRYASLARGERAALINFLGSLTVTPNAKRPRAGRSG
jgi:CxxC motif-containing protein (DUF1111 family)